MKKRLLSALLCCSLLAALCSCGEDFSDYPRDIVGTWRSEDGEDRYDVYVFNADGSGSYALFVGGSEKYGSGFTYTLSENTLTRRVGGDEISETVSIEGDKLRLVSGRYEAVLKRVRQSDG